VKAANPGIVLQHKQGQGIKISCMKLHEMTNDELWMSLSEA
jgi:hypothetical protein